MGVIDENACKRINEALQEWRQGDCVVGEHWFLFRLDINAPLTEDAAAAASAGADAGESEVRGFMVATQSCDIVRDCSERPFIEVCPLVEVEREKLEDIRRGRRPSYAFVPGAADLGLVADLDRMMTVEKAVVTGWRRTQGCCDDRERRRLSLGLARKRVRAAFPDDFVTLARPLVRRLSAKHGKASNEGRALRALREIRVRAAPSWDTDRIELMFWFIRDEDDPDFDRRRWDDRLKAWLGLLSPGGRFSTVNGVVQTLDDLTARDYVESDPLDLDHLS